MHTRTLSRLGVLAGAIALTAAAPAHAQAAPDGRWQAFVGCWEAVAPDGAPIAEMKGTNVCVLPASGRSTVDVVMVKNGKAETVSHVEATGEKKTIGRDGCTGVESAEWAADGQRVYLNADINCNGVARKTSGLLALAPNGQWMDVQGVTAGLNTGVHVTRYRAVSDIAGMPESVRSALAHSDLAVSTARMAATGIVTTDAVVDATKHVDTQVIEAWLLERGQGFALNAKTLVALADAGVPGRVTDLMVALSFPKQFAINQSSRDASRQAPAVASGNNNVVAGRTIPVYVDPAYSPYGWSRYNPYYYGYGYGYGAYGYSPYGYGGYGYYNSPIVIVRGSDNGTVNAGPSVTSRPRVVNGGGYSSGSSSSGSSSAGSSGGSSSGGSSSGSGSSGSGSTAGSGEGGSSARTAHPRP